eukprot:scaffold10909_cov172-Amphora_coffeaeformis.AAC.12
MNVVALLVVSTLVFQGRPSRATDGTTLLHKQNQQHSEEEFQYEERGMKSLRTIEAQNGNPTIPAIAPKCWKTATRLLLELTSALSSSSTGMLCQAMTEQHQKFLALEIAKCHLSDMGLELYQRDSDFVRQHCTDMIASSGEALSWDASLFLGCLKFLSSAGVNAYTHYVSHVQMLCTRLTNDVVIAYQQESHDRLRSQFHEMSQQSLAQIDTLKRVMADLTAKLEDLADFPESVREEMRQDLLEAWNESIQGMARGMEESLNSRMKEQLESGTTQLLQSLSDQHHHHWEKLLTKIVSREQEQETRHREWMKVQARLLDAQAQEIAQQRRALAHQREHITNMTALVVGATQQMKPLSSMEYFVRAAISGYGWATTILYVLCAFNVTWLVTSLSIARGVRPYLLTMVWIEGTIEILVRLSVAGSSANDECQRFINDIRLLSVIIAFATFVFGIVWSIVRYLMTCWKHAPVEDDSSASCSEPQAAEHVLRGGVGYQQGFTMYQPHNMTTKWEEFNVHPEFSTAGTQERTSYRMPLDKEISVRHRCIQIPRQQVLTQSPTGTSLVSSPVSLSRIHPNCCNASLGWVEPAKHTVTPSETSLVSSPALVSRCHPSCRNEPAMHTVTPQARTVPPPAREGTLQGSGMFFECQDVEIDEMRVDPEEDAVVEENLLGPQFSKKRPRFSCGDKKDGSESLNKKPRFIQKKY